MKSFFETIAQGRGAEDVTAPPAGEHDTAVSQTPPLDERGDAGRPSARLAIYDSLASIPRVVDLSAHDCEEFTNLVSTRTYQLSQERGGRVPFTIIKEVLENLIHACFREAVITILDDGNTIRISDQGPGISDKARALQPGFSTATTEMKRFIKGVGSGLPIVRECLALAGGDIQVEDNLDRGTVVTLKMPRAAPPAEQAPPEPAEAANVPPLTTRQKRVLFLVTELGAAGPSSVARELRVALSTAYRDLMQLEAAGLLVCDDSGKRTLSAHGVRCLDTVLGA